MRRLRDLAVVAPAGWFALGVGGSAAVAAAAGMPARDLLGLLGLSVGGALAVAVSGVGARLALRRRRIRLARQQALTAAVTAGGMLAAIALVAAGMLLSQHDLAVVLATLPVAAGAGIAFGVANARLLGSDLRALAVAARKLATGDLGARAPLGGTAEVAEVAATLNLAAVRLTEARERERAMEASRRDLVAWTSHDLRTPLTSLRAVAEALADDVITDEAVRRRYLASLSAHVDRLARLVDDLFELSQIEAGALALQFEPTHLPDLIDEVVERFTPGAEAKNVRLEARLSGDFRLLPAGRDQVGRVLANLVVNGIRHTPAGGSVLLGAADHAGHATIWIRDGCGGIPQADVPYVFDRHWRGDPARTAEGAGLGLAIARGLVEAHGGTIEVANVAGGCQFTVQLPRQARHDAERPSSTR
jgi:signal transduction histidine kinase